MREVKLHSSLGLDYPNCTVIRFGNEVRDVIGKVTIGFHIVDFKTDSEIILGEADDNTGTFPIQSERLYAAIRGNGGTVRLVMLPSEAHGYRAKETIEHVLFEEMAWFDKYLKGPQ